MSVLEVNGVISGYGGMDILREVSIRVEKHEIVTLIGPNGAGKSTLMKTIFGLLSPRVGKILFQGEDITGRSPVEIVRRGVCYVPQVENVFPSLTVVENLEMGAFIRDDDYGRRIEEVYEFFPSLKMKEKQKAGKLSGGERQMVAIGRALMLDPTLLLLDEPSAGLAPSLVEEVFDRVQGINRSGVSVLMVEQNTRQALRLSHRGYVLATGENKFDGTGAELLESPEVGRLYLGG